MEMLIEGIVCIIFEIIYAKKLKKEEIENRKYYYYLSFFIIIIALYKYKYGNSSFWTIQLIIFLIAINVGYLFEKFTSK
ncbi:Ca2+/Na+ antiporter [Peptoniphilus olsenii]|uniref:Ca2+/Na+ antiporter n=1 Tax=Peptoniphilus olsenii TaxID=411570 RepID=A0ABV2JBI4_9FIRM